MGEVAPESPDGSARGGGRAGPQFLSPPYPLGMHGLRDVVGALHAGVHWHDDRHEMRPVASVPAAVSDREAMLGVMLNVAHHTSIEKIFRGG